MPTAGRRGAALSLAPLLAGPGLLLALGLGGVTRRSVAGGVGDDVLYGFFLDRYPLFACVIAYGITRLLALAALAPGRRGWRWVTAPLAMAGLLAATLHPTFGGLVLRAGFMAGGGAFLNGTPLVASHLIGAGVAAAVFGAVLGVGGALIRRRLRREWRLAVWGCVAWSALWLAFALLGLPRALGLDPLDGWPHHPLTPRAMLLGAGLVTVALLPHALLALRRDKAAA